MRAARCVAAAVLLAAVACVPAAGADAGDDRAPAGGVITVGTEKEALGKLREGLLRADGRLFLVSPFDFLETLVLPLRREAVLREFLAVLPFDNVLKPEHVAQATAFLEKAGISEADRATLRIDNGTVTGSVEGMPLRLCTLATLPARLPKGVLAVDTAFLPAIYRNEVKTPMIDLAWKLAQTLESRGAAAQRVVVLDTTRRSDFPLGYGFLAPLLEEMFSAPQAFRTSLPEKWALLKSAEGAYYFSQYPEAATYYRQYLDRAPKDASACYKIALMALRDLDVDMTLQWLNKAVASDPLYKRAFAETAGVYYKKELYDGAERILVAGLSKYPKDPLLATNLAALHIVRADVLRDAGETEAAVALYLEAASVEGAESAMRERARAAAAQLAGPRSR